MTHSRSAHTSSDSVPATRGMKRTARRAGKPTRRSSAARGVQRGKPWSPSKSIYEDLKITITAAKPTQY